MCCEPRCDEGASAIVVFVFFGLVVDHNLPDCYLGLVNLGRVLVVVDPIVIRRRNMVPEQFRHEPTSVTAHCKHCGELCTGLDMDTSVCLPRFHSTRQLQQIASMDQSIARIADVLPTLWFGLFSKCKEAGFTEDQAMQLVKTYVTTSCRK